MGDDPIPKHPWSWFHLRRFLRRAWPGLLAIAILVSAWLIYGLFIYGENANLSRMLTEIQEQPIEDFTFDDPAWLFRDCVGPEGRYAVLTKYEGSATGVVYSAAVLDLATSRTLAHQNLGHALLQGAVFYREGEILLFHTGHRRSWKHRFVESTGTLGGQLLSLGDTHVIRIDLETGRALRPIPIGASFFPTDISSDGRRLAGWVNYPSAIRKVGVYDFESGHLSELPLFGFHLAFETTGDLVVLDSAHSTRVDTDSLQFTHVEGLFTVPEREAGYSARFGPPLNFGFSDNRASYFFGSYSGHETTFHKIRFVARYALDGTLSRRFYGIDQEKVLPNSGSFSQYTIRYPLMLSPELGLVIFSEPNRITFWNFRANRFHIIPRNNQNEIVQFLNADLIADKTGNRFRIYPVEDYFPQGFLGAEASP